MDHAEAYHKLSPFHDGELAEDERRQVARHLEECPVCRETLQAWQRLLETLLPIPEPRPTEAFVHQVMARLEAPARPVRGTRPLPDLARWLIPALSVGLAMAVFLARGPITGHAWPTEAWLLADGGADRLSTRILQAEAVRDDDLLEFILEG